MAVEIKKHCAQVSATCILNYRNAQYNNLFNSQLITHGLFCHDLAKQLSHYLYFFSFGLTTYKKCRKMSYQSITQSQSHEWMSQGLHHMTKSHEKCGKIVHRPCSSCISSVQEINENFIEFFLSTWTWGVIKLSQAKLLHNQ